MNVAGSSGTKPAPTAGGRILPRTFLAPLILMILHHLVLNGISILRVWTYLLAEPALFDALRKDPTGRILSQVLAESGAVTYASFFGMLVLIPLYLLYLYRRKKKADSLILSSRVTWIQSLSALAVVLGALGLTQLWMAILASFDPASILGRLFQGYLDKVAFFDASSSVSTLDFAATVLLVPLGEELLFRGIIQGELRRAFGPVISVVATTLLFALFHLDLIQASYVLIAGLALSAVYQLTRQLVVPMVMHVVFNFIGSGWLTRLTGGGERVAAAVVCVLYGFVLVGIAGLLILRRAGRPRGGGLT